MITSEENDLLCRVEGEAPMGQLMRRHWIPACMSEEVAEPDGTPIAVRLLGEDLVVFRDTDGRLGVLDEYCPHRRASLVVGRNEECGLRCLYHGWKFDVEGNVVEMTSEPAESGFTSKVKHKAYPAREAGGFVWTYMVPARVDGAKATDQTWLRPSTDRAPRFQVQHTSFGFRYAAIRRPIQNANTHDYVRTTVFVAPFMSLIPPNNLHNVTTVLAPIDDHNTDFYFIAWNGSDKEGIDQEAWRKFNVAQVGIDVDENYRNKRTRENTYLQDRQAMKLGNFTGIAGIPNQDIAMWETMERNGIVDRTKERLGASDIAVVEFRRLMIDAARRMRDTRVAIGQRGNWDTSFAEIGQRAGIFKKHVLALEIVYTQGSGETQQAVLSGGVDIGVAVGVMGTLSAFAKGAPVRIIGAEATGAGDLYWYVKADSPIRKFTDIAESHTIAYSTNGSSTHGIVNAFVKQFGLKARMVSTGSPSSTLTQVMSGQVDVGWSAPPFGLDQIDQGQIRVLGNGNDAAVFKGQTVRLMVVTAQTLQARKPVIERFMKAYREAIDWTYADPTALKAYADWLGITEAKAKRTRDDFFPKEAVNPDKITGLDIIVHDAVELKYTTAPLSKEQLAELIQIPPR